MTTHVPSELSVIEKSVLLQLKKLNLTGKSKILDIPCGGGRLAGAVRELGLEIHGGDLDIAAATTMGERFRIVDIDRQSLPWPAGTFDVVCTVEGIEHLENPHGFLRELHRVLRPGGRLILTTPNTVSLRSRVRFFGSGFFHKDALPLNESGRHPLHHIGLRSFSMLRYDLHTNGFELDSAGATHIKPISYAYLIFAPFMWIYTLIAFRKEKDPAQRERNRKIHRAMYSGALLLGENLILVAHSTKHS